MTCVIEETVYADDEEEAIQIIQELGFGSACETWQAEPLDSE